MNGRVQARDANTPSSRPQMAPEYMDAVGFTRSVETKTVLWDLSAPFSITVRGKTRSYHQGPIDTYATARRTFRLDEEALLPVRVRAGDTATIFKMGKPWRELVRGTVDWLEDRAARPKRGGR